MATEYYKLKNYVKQGYDFNKLYPDKVQIIQQQTGMFFSLQEIVDYLQKQTNNFKIENQVAFDIDNAIYKIINKFEKKPEVVTPEASPEEDAEVVDFLATLELLYPLLKNERDTLTPENIEDFTNTIELLLVALEAKGYKLDGKTLAEYKSVI